MNSKFDILTEADIEKIRQLVEILEKSSFDVLTLELDDIRLTVGTGSGAQMVSQSSAPAILTTAPTASHTAPTPAPAPDTVHTAKAAPAAEGLIDVTAPTMGHFYARPDPNADPYVTVGSTVGSDSTVGLLEVMKLFNSVTAGVAGTVEQICIADAELVEYGQVLMRIRPSE